MYQFDRPRTARNPKNREVRQFKATTIIVADFEYERDHPAYEAYRRENGSSAAENIRWVFNRIVCGSWVVIRFAAGHEKPIVEPFQSYCQPDCDETDIAEAFFRTVEAETIDEHRRAQLIFWGGETIDVAVLRRVAQRRDLILPLQLRKSRPNFRDRLDLCNELDAGGRRVHLSEYAAGVELPGKAMPGKEVSKLIQDEDWRAVEEQCAADVMITACIAAQHLAAIGEVGQAGSACSRAIIEAFGKRATTAYTRSLTDWLARYLREEGG